MATVGPRLYPGTPGTTLYAGLPTPSVGGLITTLSLVNTSGSTQAANFVSPMVGMMFKSGDIPAGQYPIFTLPDDTPCPATVYNDTSWPGGSKGFCGVFFRAPIAIAGSATLAIKVKSGGSAPAASSRTLSDLTAADLRVEVTGVTNLSGVWTASLNTAITDAAEIIVIGDGPAGKLWRIRGAFKQSGAAHGQLECWHYVLAAQNSAGGLSHLEYLPRVGEPWGDVASPAAARRVLNCVLKSGPTTLLTMQGHDTTETPGSNIGVPHYTSFFVCGTDGRFNFVQGGGTTSSRPTVRFQHDKTHVIKTRWTPSYSTSVNPTNGASRDYYPGGAGGMTRDMAGTGERADIGVLPSWAVRHLMTQSAVDERNVRVAGLASSGWRTAIRKSTTGQIIPVCDVSSSYTGLGTIQTTWRYFPGAEITGVQNPASNTTLWGSECESSHRPSAAFYPYLVTGEPQYLDLLTEQAAGLIMSTIAGAREMNVTLPITKDTMLVGGAFGERNVTISGTTYKGGGWMFFGGLTRIQAWMLRDLSQAAGIYPDTCPYGTETRKYLREVRDAGMTAINAYNAAIGATWSASGVYNFDSRIESSNPWCSGYMSNATCHGASVYPSSEAITFRQHLGRHWKDIAAAWDIACAVAYNATMFNESDVRILSSDLMLFQIPTTLTFSTSTNRFTVGGTLGAWSPTNSDVISLDTFFDADKPFAAATDRKRLYVVNASGNTGQLSLTPGGSSITVTSNAVVTNIWASLQNFAPHISAEGDNSANDGYLANISSAIRHHLAAGDTFIASAEAEISARLTTAGTTFTSDPKNAIVAAYPA